MTDRIVLIGLGGIGSQLLPSLVRYLGHRPEPRQLLVLGDGDDYEAANRSRKHLPDDNLGPYKDGGWGQDVGGSGMGGKGEGSGDSGHCAGMRSQLSTSSRRPRLVFPTRR